MILSSICNTMVIKLHKLIFIIPIILVLTSIMVILSNLYVSYCIVLLLHMYYNVYIEFNIEGGFIVNFVQPIRDLNQIENMKRELQKNGTRDYLLFYTGINTGLRISDILELKVVDVRDKTHISIKEKKTHKPKRFKINNGLYDELNNFINGMDDEEYIFKSKKGDNKPISRVQAYRILSDAAKRIGLSEIGTHTLRKTFGYHFYQKTKDIALLQELFNHSAPSVTLRYIGINQDIMDNAMDDFSL